MSNWTINFYLRVIALLILSIISLLSVIIIGKNAKIPWQRYLIWVFGVGTIVSTFSMMVSPVDFPKWFLLWINYYPLYSDRLTALLVFEILPFLGVFSFGTNAAKKKDRIKILVFGFGAIIVLLVLLYDPFTRPIR